ncbi:hypothetical protein CWE22_00880 [Pseudidiomarina aestuarii]|uniref:Uncharacterized protein n=1 Tax=Pseudidiomarina aestuarii TaxID=624146 RepID=A0A7Z6ZT31_9GAMM|nr:hypothetical protein [Pseudidiomarina aestuarii]RUO40788.1 hypothetical protein CWE22_00880 [Pseudidiomarina aestuarii]
MDLVEMIAIPILVLVGWIALFGGTCGWIGEKRDMAFRVWFVVGVLIPVIGHICALTWPRGSITLGKSSQ